MIAGFNIVQDHFHQEWSYFYSRLTHIWGWATWRRSWARYDEHMRDWPAVKAAGLMQDLFALPEQRRFWTRIFDQMHAGTGPDTWDYQWVYTNLIHHALSVTLRVNLTQNIGLGPEATHTRRAEEALAITAGTLSFPLVHQPAMVPSRELDELDSRLSGGYIPGIPARAMGKLRRMSADRAQRAKGTRP